MVVDSNDLSSLGLMDAKDLIYEGIATTCVFGAFGERALL
jgi:hypothetical protein